MRRLFITFIFFIPLAVLAQAGEDELVNVKELIPNVVLDIKYSSVDNFTDQKLYTTNECFLMIKTIKMLQGIQDSLSKITEFNNHTYPQGIGIKIYDGYRPRAVQYLMWEILPNTVYVANPATGSVHNRGGAVDISLVDLATGEELLMPTEFDFFGDEAHHFYTGDLPQEAINNRELLRTVMEKFGFNYYVIEWWHYTLPSPSNYPLLDFQMK